jgi:hypothetical protein
MTKSKVVPASQFRRNFGRYCLLAHREAVEVTSHGHVTGYFVHVEEYRKFMRFKTRRRSFATSDLSESEVGAIAEVRMDARHDHLNTILIRK